MIKTIADKCRLFTIDEAHCMKAWGESNKTGMKPFRKHFKELALAISKLAVCNFMTWDFPYEQLLCGVFILIISRTSF